jgi:hypothetical protein
VYWHGTHAENIEEQIARWFPRPSHEADS